MTKDCVILLADLDTENVIKGLLTRPSALGCRSFSFDVFRHSRRDPGVRLESADFLRAFASDYGYAVVILDRHGSGADAIPPERIEQDIEDALQATWPRRAVAIVIDPELEVWVWSDSPEVDVDLGWQGRTPSLRQWLASENLWQTEMAKPADPKRAYQQALLHVRKARSASIFESLAGKVSTKRCTDRAFLKLRRTLSTWFPPQP